MNYWSKVKHLFEVNDPSLPDIFVDDLSPIEIAEIYKWLMSRASVAGDPTVWSKIENRDVPIREIEDPIQAYFSDSIEPFHHRLLDLHVNSVLLPELSIMVEPTTVSFDYRMGPEWKEPELLALFHMLRSILKIAPTARILHAHEGMFEHPNPEFTEAFNVYVSSCDP